MTESSATEGAIRLPHAAWAPFHSIEDDWLEVVAEAVWSTYDTDGVEDITATLDGDEVVVTVTGTEAAVARLTADVERVLEELGVG